MVNDLLTKIREEQDSPFKSATPDEIETRKGDLKKERLAALKGRTADVCPHCGADLREVGVWGKEQTRGTVSKNYMASNDGTPGYWEWGDTDTIDSEINSWHCGECEDEIERGRDFETSEPVDESVKEANTPFKPASKGEVAKRQASCPSALKQIETIEQLQRLAEYGVEVTVVLNYGARSSKYVTFDSDAPEGEGWSISNYIDGSEDIRIEDTNIPEALEKGALWYDRDEYESSRQQGADEQLPEAKTPFVPASKKEVEGRQFSQFIRLDTEGHESAQDYIISLGTPRYRLWSGSYSKTPNIWYETYWRTEDGHAFEIISDRKTNKLLAVWDLGEYEDESDAETELHGFSAEPIVTVMRQEGLIEAQTPFVPAGKAELAQRAKDAPIFPEDFEWYNQLQEIINGYKGGETDPLDGDEVDKLTELIRMKLNYMEGNITREEYQNAPIGD